MNLSLVILAAGMGSRYGGLKQMDPIGPHGETVLDYSTYDAWRAGFTKVIFVIREEFAATFEETIGAPLAGKLEVAYVHQKLTDLPGKWQPPEERAKPWGTAHAIWSARHAIDEPFSVINADDFYGIGAFRALRDFFERVPPYTRPLPCALVAYRLRNTLSEHGTVSRGVLRVAENGFLREITERTDVQYRSGNLVARGQAGDEPLDPDTLVSMNCWGFQPAILDHFERRIDRFLESSGREMKSEIYVADPVESAIQLNEATFRVLSNDEPWFGMTYQEDKERAVAAINALIESGKYPKQLWS